MFIVMFTRLTGQEESIFLDGTFDTYERAYERMKELWDERVNGENATWDPEWSTIYGTQAFCGTADLYDTVRLYIFDSEHPVGFVNDRAIEFDDSEDW